MHYAKLASLILLCAALLLQGCHRAPVPTPALVVLEEDNLPFSLRILDEVNDGTQLHVLAAVRAHMAWNAEKVAVRLTGMHGGQVVAAADTSLQRALKRTGDTVIRPGEDLTFALSVPIAGISDYQLELLWGAEARAARNLRDFVRVQNTALTLPAPDCTGSQCGANPLITAEILNESGQVVRNVILALGLAWEKQGEPLDLSKTILENERSIQLRDVNLQPNQVRQVRLVLDQGLPEVAGGSYRAIVRVVSVEAQ